MILMYHNIDINPGANTVSIADFENQMNYISRHFNPVDFDTYFNGLDTANNENNVTVTFDDAYINIKHLVWPVIEKYKIPIIVFVPTAHVGKFNSWDGGLNKVEILDWPEIQAMNKLPFIKFGSHGYNHVSFGHIDDDERDIEFKKSKEDLEQNLQQPIYYFAYPFGQAEHIGKNDQWFLEKYGYKAALTTNWALKNSKRNKFLLNRIDIRSEYSFDQFKKIVTGKNKKLRYKQLIKNIVYKIKH